MQEVVHTLVEAFVLVVIVVFLFLGNFRATLIPLIAVPVSLIGTFAVMLALGFSANTVSLLALVLAIGIVVDDAIVVVEAVEAHLEKDHTISPAEAARRAMQEITAPIIAITLVLLSVFVPVGVHSRHFGRAVPAVRRRGLGVDGDLGDQRADAVAGALRGVPVQEPRTEAGRFSATCCAASTGRATATPSSCARPCGWRCSVCWCWRVVMAGAGWLFKMAPTGFLPSEDQGAVFGEIQLPEGASVNRTDAVTKRVEEIIRNTPGVANVTSVVGYSLIDGLAKSNGALADHHAQAVRRTQERGAVGRTASSPG